MLRLLADENFPVPAIRLLRAGGYDVAAVKEWQAGADDSSVLAKAQSEGRILVTHDKDFGDLAFHARLSAHSGVILFRLRGATPEADNARILSAIESRKDWAGHFSTVTDSSIRMRPLVKPSPG